MFAFCFFFKYYMSQTVIICYRHYCYCYYLYYISTIQFVYASPLSTSSFTCLPSHSSNFSFVFFLSFCSPSQRKDIWWNKNGNFINAGDVDIFVWRVINCIIRRMPMRYVCDKFSFSSFFSIFLKMFAK